MSSRRILALLVALVTLIALAGCGGSDDASEDCDDNGGLCATIDEESAGGSRPEGAREEAVEPAGDTTGQRIELGDSGALLWGGGAQGVVLAHGSAFDAASWEKQATQIAEQDATVVAVEDTSPDSIEAAADRLRDEEGAEQVILIGGSSGADAILDLASEQPDLPDGLILISPNSTVEGLGTEPKLFIASEDESVADVATELADTAPGGQNTSLLLPGDGHAQNIFDTDQARPLTQAILERLREQAPA